MLSGRTRDASPSRRSSSRGFAQLDTLLVDVLQRAVEAESSNSTLIFLGKPLGIKTKADAHVFFSPFAFKDSRPDHAHRSTEHLSFTSLEVPSRLMYSQVVYGDIVTNVFIPAAAQGNFDPTTLGACAARLVR